MKWYWIALIVLGFCGLIYATYYFTNEKAKSPSTGASTGIGSTATNTTGAPAA